MASVEDITPALETAAPSYKVIGFRRPIVFACIPLAPFLVYLLWELLSK